MLFYACVQLEDKPTKYSLRKAVAFLFVWGVQHVKLLIELCHFCLGKAHRGHTVWSPLLILAPKLLLHCTELRVAWGAYIY